MRDKEIWALKDENKKLQENLKKVHAVVRSPKLSDIYKKEELKIKSKKKIEKEKTEAFHELR